MTHDDDLGSRTLRTLAGGILTGDAAGAAVAAAAVHGPARLVFICVACLAAPAAPVWRWLDQLGWAIGRAAIHRARPRCAACGRSPVTGELCGSCEGTIYHLRVLG